MITCNLGCSTSIELKDYLWLDTRANLYSAIKAMGIRGLSKAPKDVLIDAIEYFLLDEHLSFLFETVLKDELDFIRQLITAGPNGFIGEPMKKDFSEYMIQKLYLVLTYEDFANRKYYFHMPDEVRENCIRCLKKRGEAIDKGKQKAEADKVMPFHVKGAEDVYIPEHLRPMVEKQREEMLTTLKSQDCPEPILQMFRNMSAEDLLKTFGYNMQKAAFEESAVDAKIVFQPAMSFFNNIKLPKGTAATHKVLNKGTVVEVYEFTQEPRKQYVSIYFLKMSPNQVKIAACLGDVINSIYGRNVLGARELPLIPKYAKHHFPFLYKHINHRKEGYLNGAYLNTISINEMPKQWFVMRNLPDKNSDLWEKILYHGPFIEEFAKPASEVVALVRRIMHEIFSSGHRDAIDHLNRYMEEGESSCELLAYTPKKL